MYFCFHRIVIAMHEIWKERFEIGWGYPLGRYWGIVSLWIPPFTSFWVILFSTEMIAKDFGLFQIGFNQSPSGQIGFKVAHFRFMLSRNFEFIWKQWPKSERNVVAWSIWCAASTSILGHVWTIGFEPVWCPEIRPKMKWAYCASQD